MTDHTQADTTTPVSDDTIRTVAEGYDLPESDVRALLDRITADIENAALTAEFDDYHDLKGVSRGVRVYLCPHGSEVDELADHAAAALDLDLPKTVAPSTLARAAYDRDAREQYADVFGGRQEAVGATSAADALLVADN